MASIQATRLRKGNLIKVGDDLLRILELHHLTPGNKRGFVQCKARNIRTSTLVDHKFRAEEDIERAILDEHDMQYLYTDGDSFHFMNTASFEQLHIDREVLGDAVNYILPDSIIKVEFYGDEPVGIDLPVTVDLRVEDTVPGIKGATASAQVKPARTETGLVVQVPPFINVGDRIRVSTETGEYQSRVRDGRPDIRNPAHGWIEVITGSMFSGKSEELIRRLRRAQIARQRVQIFKPAFDNRFAEAEIVSHSEMRIQGVNVGSSAELLRLVNDDTEVVGIDEAQFFDKDLPAACTQLAGSGKRVVVAGLDTDYLGRPFEPMPVMMAIAEYVTKTHAICMVCGNPASHTQRLVVSDERLLLGATGTYEARCRKCFDPTLASRRRRKSRTKVESEK